MACAVGAVDRVRRDGVRCGGATGVAGVIAVMQREVGDGKDGRPMGDCMRACLASIFELPIDVVPHLATLPAWPRDLDRWLAPMGLAHERMNWPASPSPGYWPAGWWMASVLSENIEGATHAVVMRGTGQTCGGDEWMAVAHDPSPHPRRTPYVFVGGMRFVALDPAAIARRAAP